MVNDPLADELVLVIVRQAVSATASDERLLRRSAAAYGSTVTKIAGHWSVIMIARHRLVELRRHIQARESAVAPSRWKRRMRTVIRIVVRSRTEARLAVNEEYFN